MSEYVFELELIGEDSYIHTMSMREAIVRCGECMHSREYRPDGTLIPNDGRFCSVVKLTWERDFFCALGNRREDA